MIFDEDLSPVQGSNLEKTLGVRVMDRAELILDIFATRARSREAKLQVELAQLEYLLPRLRRMWTHLSRIRGGIGLRGPGETQLETDRRLIRRPYRRPQEQAQGGGGRARDPEEVARGALSGRARGVYERRKVVASPSTLRGRPLHRRPALRDVGFCDPDRRLGPGAGGSGDRHGGVHPEASTPPGRVVPVYARGGARGRHSASGPRCRASGS